jgi:hypothetical protein
MIQKIFYTIPEVMAALNGDGQLLLEMIEFHGLRFYYRLGHERASDHWDEDGFIEDTLRTSGQHELARWRFISKPPLPDKPDEDQSYYVLSGWFEVTTATTILLASGAEDKSPSVHSYKNGSRYGTFHGLERPMSLDCARVRVADLDRLLATDTDKSGQAVQTAKEIQSRERNNLLRVIVGLAQEARIDVEDIGTAAKQMEAAARGAGFNGPTSQTIRKWLNDLPEPDN